MKVVDPAADFDKPVKIKPKQEELLDAGTQPVEVIDGFIRAKFLKPHHDLEKSGRRNIGLEFSFPVSDEHSGFIPKKIEEAYDWLVKTGNKSAQVTGVAMQRVTVVF